MHVVIMLFIFCVYLNVALALVMVLCGIFSRHKEVWNVVVVIAGAEPIMRFAYDARRHFCCLSADR